MAEDAEVIPFPAVRRVGQIRKVADSYFIAKDHWRGVGNVRRHVGIYQNRLVWQGVPRDVAAAEAHRFHETVVALINAELAEFEELSAS